MSASPSSGLSAEAKEFVPLVQSPTTASIPLYVDENAVATIYSSDQPPFVIQTIYPMMISNSTMTDTAPNSLLPFPEIEFHIQPSQQQQFHMDSCSSHPQASSTNASSTTTSQIVLLPTTAAGPAAGTPTGYYPAPQMIYSPNEQTGAFYPIDYCEQPLISFSLQQPALLGKPNRISSQQQPRPTSFRQQYGNNPSPYRTSHRGGSGNPNPNRQSYYEYPSRRNGSSYPVHPGRGNASHGRRISSSYHQQDNSQYYPHPSSRSRGGGYAARPSHYHDEQRKDHSDYYNHEFYENDYQPSNELNDDGTPFEFRPEDFPSLPINQPSDKATSQSLTSTTGSSASSWNAIVSAPRPHSTSPHSMPPSSLKSLDQRSDRSRSFNTKVSSTKESQLSNSNNKKPSRPTHLATSSTTAKSKSPPRASKLHSEDEDQPQKQPSELLVSPSKVEDNGQDDGFMQTKQQQRRLKRKNKMKEELLTPTDPFNSHGRDSRHSSPSVVPLPDVDHQSDNHSTVNNDPSSGLITRMNQINLSMTLNTASEIPQHASDTPPSAISTGANAQSLVSNRAKERHTKKSKSSIIQASERARPNGNDIPSETDIPSTGATNEDDQNAIRLSSNVTNSSDTSDYDDAVDNLADE